ncbi:Uncharacterised protein [Legionella wadsworthii]|uniref:Uncharacterized protein n=1 Tax=Legionella wadsworthii TaxID=28088 RepID=A0A378LXD7_9GAMM|nr:hypothetical protein [Legionella wadsworthii]STY31094.1 Uncharacterised protein [Legionella wadsworthii]
MKNLIMCFFILSASLSVAATQTDLKSKWVCTTNASKSDDYKESVADDKMGHTQNSAKQSFAFAAEHCRDCTKITCEATNNY